MAVASRPRAFVAVGAAAACVHMAAVAIAVEAWKIAPATANVAAFCAAFLVSYAGHRRYSFAATRGVAGSMGRWFAVSLGGFLLNQLLYMAALHLFPVSLYLPLLAVVTLLVAAISYCLGKFWAFSSRRHAG